RTDYINCYFPSNELQCFFVPSPSLNCARKKERRGLSLTTQQLLTPHQSQYFAWLLTRRAAGDSVESLAPTLVDSQVDLNPHQVEAALFACRKTALLRDVNERNLGHFEQEVQKLDAWADALKLGLEQDIKEIDREIKEV